MDIPDAATLNSKKKKKKNLIKGNFWDSICAIIKTERKKKKKKKEVKKMKFNESCNSTAKATIACRDSHDCESSNHHSAKGARYYEQKAYNPTIKIICEINGVTLRTVKSLDTKVEILIDGELFNRYPSVKVAETFFVDFANISKAKYKKIACLA